jgi:hypothetical protein
MKGRSSTARWVELLAIALFLLYLTSSDSLIDVPLCLNRCLGIRCPTCGTTRSLWHLLHGKFVEAWALNPIGYVALFVLARRAFVLARPRHPMIRLVEHRWLDVGLLTGYLIFGSLRLIRVL